MSFVFLGLLKVCLSRCKYSIFIIPLFCGRIAFSYFMSFMTITHSKKDKMSQTVILQTFYTLFTFILHTVYKLFTRRTYLTENQDDTFCVPKGGFSGSNMPSFRTQKAVFCKAKGHLLPNAHAHARKKYAVYETLFGFFFYFCIIRYIPHGNMRHAANGIYPDRHEHTY